MIKETNRKAQLNFFIFILVFLSVFIQSCNSDKAENFDYTIFAEISGLDDGIAVLAKLDLVNNETIIIDSTTIKNGEFIFNGSIKHPYLHTILLNSSKNKIHFFLENSKIHIIGDINKLEKINISGSREDSLFRSYSFDDIFERNKGKEIMLKYNDYVFSAFVAYYQFQLFNIQIDTMQHIIDNYSEKVKMTDYFKHLKELHESIKRVAISKPAPGFSIPNKNGDTIKLNDFKGKYVLIDFWASWCAPCRASNPTLLKNYNMFKNRNFTIVGISVDKNKKQWLNTIEKDSLIWANLSNLNGWDKVSNLYGVKAVPQNFLLDPEGIIIDKNIDVDFLTEKLNKILPNK